MTTDLPPWLAHDGTHADLQRVATRIAAREWLARQTAPKPVRAPNVGSYGARPPASIRYSREAWESLYPDPHAKWWKAWAHPFKPEPPANAWDGILDLMRRMRAAPLMSTPAQHAAHVAAIKEVRASQAQAAWLDAENARLDQIEADVAHFAEHPPTGLLAHMQKEA
jgi:hypothetical protein